MVAFDGSDRSRWGQKTDHRVQVLPCSATSAPVSRSTSPPPRGGEKACPARTSRDSNFLFGRAGRHHFWRGVVALARAEASAIQAPHTSVSSFTSRIGAWWDPPPAVPPTQLPSAHARHSPALHHPLTGRIGLHVSRSHSGAQHLVVLRQRSHGIRRRPQSPGAAPDNRSRQRTFRRRIVDGTCSQVSGAV